MQRLLSAISLFGSVITLAISLLPLHAQAQASSGMMRLKEIATVQGVRSNQLTGYGLVIGLDGTGDQTSQMPYTSQSIANYLQQQGISLPQTGGSPPQMRNIAAVIVTAQLPPFAQPGQSIDVVVSSIGNAKSLRGGTLIATPLKGVDGQVYAIAQGNLLVGGAGASAGGSRVQINHLSAGRIPSGASVERTVPTPLLSGSSIQLSLNSSDFLTATRVAQAINDRLGSGLARALDGRTVEVDAPENTNARVSFLASLEEVSFETSKPVPKVVINARTGSIVLNQAVTLGPCAVAHGSLSVTISSTPVISQPGAFSQGQTVVAQKTDITISQESGAVMHIAAAPLLTDVVRALNTLGANPQDLVAILQAMKASNALQAELEII